jgi:RNA-directed DNA polymerase
MSILTRISSESGIPLAFLSLVARTTDHRYKLYTLPKVSGGHRLIQHPAREMKFLQRWVISQIFGHAPVHPAATAYRQGTSVRNNAALHAHGRFFLKLDFEDFFPSIRVTDVKSLLTKVSSILPVSLTEEDIDVVAKIVTRHGQLPIGAPSSPVISNAVMYRFDDAMSRLAEQFTCVYSRYADDIVFSTNLPYVLESVLKEVREYVSVQLSPALRVNEAKVVFNSKKRRVRITGLVIDCSNNISVGRDDKRKIKALIHQFKTENLDVQNTSYLKGYLGYLNSVEPKFVDTLVNKYGKEVLDAISRTQTVRLKT